MSKVTFSIKCVQGDVGAAPRRGCSPTPMSTVSTTRLCESGAYLWGVGSGSSPTPSWAYLRTGLIQYINRWYMINVTTNKQMPQWQAYHQSFLYYVVIFLLFQFNLFFVDFNMCTFNGCYWHAINEFIIFIFSETLSQTICFWTRAVTSNWVISGSAPASRKAIAQTSTGIYREPRLPISVSWPYLKVVFSIKLRPNLRNQSDCERRIWASRCRCNDASVWQKLLNVPCEFYVGLC